MVFKIIRHSKEKNLNENTDSKKEIKVKKDDPKKETKVKKDDDKKETKLKPPKDLSREITKELILDKEKPKPKREQPPHLKKALEERRRKIEAGEIVVKSKEKKEVKKEIKKTEKKKEKEENIYASDSDDVSSLDLNDILKD